MRFVSQLALVFVALAARTAAAADDMAPITSFGSNPGALNAYEHIPANLPANAPLVVVLHGCTQQAVDMVHAGWNTLADANGFAVVYAEQTTANNPLHCFNWAGENGDTANLVRGMGENESIIQIVDTAIAAHHLDTTRVYVTGVSAGAAMSAVMLATWPDRFAAGSIMAGIPYRCGTSLTDAYACQSGATNKTPTQWGDLVRAASTTTTFPRVQIWQGTSDSAVNPANAQELVSQWTNVHGDDQTADSTMTDGVATITTYGASVELWSIANMNHGISIGGTSCPASAASYFIDTGVCSTLHAAEFFGLLGTSSGSGSGSGSGSSMGDDDGTGGNTGNGGGGGCSTCGGSSLAFGFGLLGLAVQLRRRRQPTTL
ncbi:MAG TPA: PHB depolymerase family esterase [Kofleriaceae bacterium]|jgi:poly(hydroxyalkanoate) depolymerase family esterase